MSTNQTHPTTTKEGENRRNLSLIPAMGLKTLDGSREVVATSIQGVSGQKMLGGLQKVAKQKVAKAAEQPTQGLSSGGQLHMYTSMVLGSFLVLLGLSRYAISASMDA